MNFSLWMAKQRLLYKIFVASSKDWVLPEQSEILIYDKCGADVLEEYLRSYSVGTLSVRGETINMPCLLQAMFKIEFWKRHPLSAYTEVFIQAVSPKVIVTFIDNNAGFYTISNRFPKIKTILIQNGLRDDWLGGSSNSKKYHVDYMLVFGASIAKYYQKYITGAVVPIGSFKNNKIRQSGNAVDGIVLFISQYREKPNSNVPFFVSTDGMSIYFDQFYSCELQVLNFLSKWCNKNKKYLQICGASLGETGQEEDFYRDILIECDWEYIPKSDPYSSYALVDSAEIVVCIDSTLGHESIGRGKKTAFFSSRGEDLNRVDRKFGWPSELTENGPFWTNERDDEQLQRVMDYLSTVSESEWEQTRKLYTSQIMGFDSGNTCFISLVQQLLPRAEILTNVN